MFGLRLFTRNSLPALFRHNIQPALFATQAGIGKNIENLGHPLNDANTGMPEKRHSYDENEYSDVLQGKDSKMSSGHVDTGRTPIYEDVPKPKNEARPSGIGTHHVERQSADEAPLFETHYNAKPQGVSDADAAQFRSDAVEHKGDKKSGDPRPAGVKKDAHA